MVHQRVELKFGSFFVPKYKRKEDCFEKQNKKIFKKSNVNALIFTDCSVSISFNGIRSNILQI